MKHEAMIEVSLLAAAAIGNTDRRIAAKPHRVAQAKRNKKRNARNQQGKASRKKNRK